MEVIIATQEALVPIWSGVVFCNMNQTFKPEKNTNGINGREPLSHIIIIHIRISWRHREGIYDMTRMQCQRHALHVSKFGIHHLQLYRFCLSLFLVKSYWMATYLEASHFMFYSPFLICSKKSLHFVWLLSPLFNSSFFRDRVILLWKSEANKISPFYDKK